MNTPQEFAAVLSALRGLPRGEAAALATLTQTRGSTFRRAGARMLVLADGRLVRGLSAGCPEQDIAARARDALHDGHARILRYDRDQNTDVLLEMGCGGELEVLIEPLPDAEAWAFAEAVQRLVQQRKEGVLATWYAESGLALARPRHWLWSDGVQRDELEQPDLVDQLIAQMTALPSRLAPTVLTLGPVDRPHQVLVERVSPPPAALIVGVNASAVALCRLLRTLGWEACLIDHREQASESDELLAGTTRQFCPPERVRDLHTDPRTCAVVMTHNLERDIAYLQALHGCPLGYLGAVGARRRAARLFEATGLDAQRLHTPAGLDIGSETPEEIALAIAAEMLAALNRTGGAPLSTLDVPIHR